MLSPIPERGTQFLGAFCPLPELYPCICVVSDTGDYSIVFRSCHSHRCMLKVHTVCTVSEVQALRAEVRFRPLGLLYLSPVNKPRRQCSVFPLYSIPTFLPLRFHENLLHGTTPILKGPLRG